MVEALLHLSSSVCISHLHCANTKTAPRLPLSSISFTVTVMSLSSQPTIHEDSAGAHPCRKVSLYHQTPSTQCENSLQPSQALSLFDQDKFQSEEGTKIMTIDALCSTWAKKTGVTLTAAGGHEEVRARRCLFSPRGNPRNTVSQ
jgi:hypothetical protein